MVYVISCTGRQNHPCFMPCLRTGLARHTTKSAAEFTMRQNAESGSDFYRDAVVMKFDTMEKAGEWLAARRDEWLTELRASRRVA